ncbi:MAG: phosphoribosylamine--glycine ligase [bacterium]|jgi:phosphoribosylamine--glycine ligase|nr:phosphoribosylamine--glycine ligase [bacterium]
MNILVIGGGGREHALIWKLKQSSGASEIFCIPGNAGIAQLAKCVDKPIDDFPYIEKYCKNNNIGLIIVGPEVPLIKGFVDYFEKKNFKVFGPNKLAAQLEGSKAFAKTFMKKCNIPTAGFEIFTSPKQALEFIKNPHFSNAYGQPGYPIVIKADGLAAGKGVMICHTLAEAEKAIDVIMLKKVFGTAGDKVVIEEFIAGEEASILCFTDGETIEPMVPVQDHKRIYDDDQGPNTGGMGCYAPVTKLNDDLHHKIREKVLQPTINGLKQEKIVYRGVIYVGIMIVNGDPFVLEYNVRFGDPETQVIMPLLKTDLLKIIEYINLGKLKDIKVEWANKHCVCVVIASSGYPGGFQKGKLITGLGETAMLPETMVFHAGTSFPQKETVQGLIEYDRSQIITAGGRVLGVTVTGNTLKEAIDRAYEAVPLVKFEGAQWRKDIGRKGL